MESTIHLDRYRLFGVVRRFPHFAIDPILQSALDYCLESVLGMVDIRVCWNHLVLGSKPSPSRVREGCECEKDG